MPKGLNSFAARVVAWQRQAGRHDLPWQRDRDPYRVWLSEIMLQQTQVSTVVGYFERFVAQLPTVQHLANASEDEVLGLWSGLGYYARARNLHRAAQQIMQQHGGEFPRTAQECLTLPGVGRSTAAAITSVCFGERESILDGNVKRLLSRYLGFAGDLAQAREVDALWAQAQALLPKHSQDMPTYTQALMDLGALCCKPRQTDCARCPVRADCRGHAEGDPLRYPIKTKRLLRRAETWWVLLAYDRQQRVALLRRPPRGVWGGLYAPPMWREEAPLQALLHPDMCPLVDSVRKHVLTHKDLYLHPIWVPWTRAQAPEGQWVSPETWPTLGLPAPVREWLIAGPPTRGGAAG